MSKKVEEPEYIHWPGVGEFCRGTSCDGEKCCLGGWVRLSFFGHPSTRRRDHPYYPAYIKFVQELNKAAERRGFDHFEWLNDHYGTSDDTRAAVYSEAARARGYEEVP